MNQSPVITSLVLVTTLLAATFAALAWSSGRSAGEAATLRRLEEGLGSLGERLERAGTDLAELARKVDRLAEASPPRRDGEDAGAGSAGDGGGAGQGEAMQAILDRLDGIAAKVEKAAAAPQAIVIPAAAQLETAEERQRIVEENQSVALDRRRTPEERLMALRELRGRDGRSHEVVLGLLELIETPDLDPRRRADIIRNLDGVDFPELKDPLLRILANDTHSETRSETIETLQPFYGDPEVHAAVAKVRDSDADIRVRMEALERMMQYEFLKARVDKAGER
jgi:hypothetical protein